MAGTKCGARRCRRGRLRRDWVAACDGQAGVGDGVVEVLATVVDTATATPILWRGQPAAATRAMIGASSYSVAAAAVRRDVQRPVLGCGGDQRRGEAGWADLGQVLGVEASSGPRRRPGGDLRGAQRGDPPEIRCGVRIVLSSHSAAMRAEVIMPRSPTSTSLSSETDAHSSRCRRMRRGRRCCRETPARRPGAPGVGEDTVFDCRSLLAVAGVAARGQPQHRPVAQEEVRSNNAIRPDGRAKGGGEIAFDGSGDEQPIHRSVDLVGGAPATPRSVYRVKSGHPRADSLEAGRTTREMISASARSRARHDGPSRAGSPAAAPSPRPRPRAVRQRPGDGELATGRHQLLTLERRVDEARHGRVAPRGWPRLLRTAGHHGRCAADAPRSTRGGARLSTCVRTPTRERDCSATNKRLNGSTEA